MVMLMFGGNWVLVAVPKSPNRRAVALDVSGHTYVPVMLRRPGVTGDVAIGFVLSDGVPYFLGTDSKHNLYWGPPQQVLIRSSPPPK